MSYIAKVKPTLPSRTGEWQRWVSQVSVVDEGRTWLASIPFGRHIYSYRFDKDQVRDEQWAKVYCAIAFEKNLLGR